MNEKEDFFKDPDGNDLPASKGRPPRRRKGMNPFVMMMVIGAAVLILFLLVVDITNSGGRIKELIAGKKEEPVAVPRPETKPEPGNEPEVIEKIVEVPVEKVVERVVEKIVEVEVKKPMPSSYVEWQKVDTAQLWNEIPVKTEMKTSRGDRAAVARENDESYQIEMTVKLAIPKPNESAKELESINPSLPKMLADFETLVESAEVSPFFHHLYELKTERIQQNVTRLDKILSRHNLYDCETVLQIQHPETKEKVLLVQGEMDVVTDGSDGDRMSVLDDYISMSDYYQPFTSYGWPKKTTTPNPLLARWEGKLKEYEKEFAIKGLSIERNRFLRSQIEIYKPGVEDMKARSYLIAETDPFFVLPLSFLGRKDENAFGPAIGDYGVIIYGDKLYPAIAGDAGPSWKFGEGSLRLAKELNEKATPYNRPVSDLHVTYLIFPGSADEKKGPPNLEAWRERCAELLDGIGGLGEGYELHEWVDLIARRNAGKKAKEEAEKKAADEAAEAKEEPAQEKPAEPSEDEPQ